MFWQLSSATQGRGLIELTDYFACWFHSPFPSTPSTRIHTTLLLYFVKDKISSVRDQTTSAWAWQMGRRDSNHSQQRGGTAGRSVACEGESPRRSPPPAGQPAGSPALSGKVLSPRLLRGSPWEGSGLLAHLRLRRGRAQNSIESTPTGGQRRGKRGREDGQDSATLMPTSQPALPPGSESRALPGSSAPAAPRG